MTNQPSSSTYSDEFAGWVKSALHQIYDSPYLQTHPLARLLAEPQMDTLQQAQNLRKLLLNAIDTLRPAENQPANSANWRAYQILELRYIEGLSTQEIMSRLAISRSYYFHEHGRMLDSLTTILWDQYQEKLRQRGVGESVLSQTEMARQSEEREGTDQPDAEDEFQRMVSKAVWQLVEIPALLEQLRPIIEPTLRDRQLALEVHFREPGIAIRADRVLLRQVLLNILSYAMEMAFNGSVTVEGFRQQGDVEIRVAFEESRLAEAELPAEHQVEARLEVCRRLMADLKGTLTLEHPTPRQWVSRLHWAAASQLVLLVIDDNEELADLFSRYLAGHRWQVIGAPDGKTARQQITERRPDVILLDIMMPQEDGWELLMSLKAREDTRQIPVIVCSVLPEEKLALSLGADAYLTKPISQQALLRTLARWNPPSRIAA